MRVLGVHFKNLNSLTGEWHVDFAHPVYASDGIFAITGPTGAGKTTILDAICLGLYGRTPRLDKVTKSSNEIMSRHMGECFAEVTFETQKGRFRAHWSQHRARKHPEGELQQAKHEIVDAYSGAVLESKITQVGELVEKVTGMDFERFTRSMLLAQGGFTAFLQASPDARAPILEQITGTEIYSNISMKVHERRGQERDKLGLLQAELKGIRLLSEEEKGNLQDSLAEKQSLEKQVDLEVQGLRTAVLWLESLLSLEKEIKLLDMQWGDFETERQDFAPEAARLERSRKAEGLAGDYREVELLRRQQAGETKELEAATTLLSAKEEDCAAALARKISAEALLQGARGQQQSQRDVIKKVRDIDIRVAGLKKQIRERQRDISDVEKQGMSHKNNLGAHKNSLKDAQAELEAIHDYQTRYAVDAGLVTNLTAIIRSLAAFRDAEKRYTKGKEQAAGAAEKQMSCDASLKRIEGEHQKLREDLEQKEKEAKRLADEISVVLNGRDITEWRGELDALKNRERHLAHITEVVGRADGVRAAVLALSGKLAALKTDQTRLSKEIKVAHDQKVVLEKDVSHLEDKVSLLNRIRNLEDQRKRLEDGSPCPLCGSFDHPYARGNIPELEEAETALKNVKADHKRMSDTLVRVEKEQVKTTTAIGHTEAEMDEKQALLDADENEAAESLTRLGIIAGPENRVREVQQTLAAIQNKIAETSGILSTAEDKSKKEKAVGNILESERAKLSETGKSMDGARLAAEAAILQHQQMIRNGEALADETGKAREAVLNDVEPFEVGQVSSDTLENIQKMLKGRKDAWETKAGQKIACVKKMDHLKAEMDKTQALLEAMETDLQTRRKDLETLKVEFESMGATRRELFGEKDTDSEEERLATAVKGAEETQEKTRIAHGALEKEIAGLKELIASLREKTGSRATELVGVEQKLTERIKKVGFGDEADYRSSCLREDERETLAKQESSLIAKKAELEARRKDRSEALVSEREKRLTDLSVETLRPELVKSEGGFKQLQEDIGAIKNSLIENEKLKEKQQERFEKIDAQKKECARWDELHQLIGSADGKKFRNFAQGLTFEIMVSHANRQLLKMTDRYVLTRDDSQPLELCVVDNYQAGEIRSTKNLSGGEAFIVSLALALGLSQMASRNVRVDSLFLDEGFGALDEDALETALETLAGLQQDGKLIGVISHVPALKERIGTQIQVIPQTGGRSIIEGPGCSSL
jgi:DNA repair protein SbcC/Rad50